MVSASARASARRRAGLAGPVTCRLIVGPKTAGPLGRCADGDVHCRQQRPTRSVGETNRQASPRVSCGPAAAEAGSSMPWKSRQLRPSSAVAMIEQAEDRCLETGRAGLVLLALVLP